MKLSVVHYLQEQAFRHLGMRSNVSEESFVHIPEDAITFPRQKREPAFFTNGAIYLRPKSLIKTYKSGGWQLGNKPGYVVMDEFESVNIDSNFDLIYAKAVLDYLESVAN